MRVALTIISLAVVLGMSGTSSAELSSSNIHVESQLGGLTIRIDNMQVEHNSLETRGDRIYINVPAVATEQQIRLSKDKTIKMVEMSAGRRPRISVQLRHGRQKTRAIGMASTIENINGGIVMHIPRWPILNETASATVKETMVTARAIPQPVMPVKEVAGPARLKPEPIVESIIAADTIAPPADQEQEGSIAGTRTEGSGSSLGLIVGLLLIVAGAGVVYWRSRQPPREAAELGGLRIVASKALGGKAKVVWLNVGERNMIVSVGESGTQLLSEWGQGPASPGSKPKTPLGLAPLRGEIPWPSASSAPIQPTLMDMPAPKPLPVKAAASPEVYDFRSTLRAARELSDQEDIFGPAKGQSTGLSMQSPAVAGLMKLREQGPVVNVEVATQDADADAEWARELLKATRETMFKRAD